MPVTIPYTVGPGDVITASVSYAGKNNFLLTISDDHWGASF
jgi:exosome complex RNA-binding protein Csl4